MEPLVLRKRFCAAVALIASFFFWFGVVASLFVVNRKPPKPLARKARARLDTPHSKMLGIILNQVDTRNDGYSYYYGHYNEYYGSEPPKEASTG